MTATTYPKTIVLERLRAAREQLTAEEATDLKKATATQYAFINDMSKWASEHFAHRVNQATTAIADFESVVADETSTNFQRVKAAIKAKEVVASVDRGTPYIYDRDAKDVATRVSREYDLKRGVIDRKIAFIESADAPDGFTMTALKELNLLEYVR